MASFSNPFIECDHNQEKARVNAGFQCPECYGVHITRQESRFSGQSEDKFSCRSCGCQWSRN